MKTVITLTICLLFAASSFATGARVDSDLSVNGTLYLNGSSLKTTDGLLRIKGEWLLDTPYSVGDVVQIKGSTYVCINANVNNQPPDTKNWTFFASQFGVAGTCGVGQFMRGFNKDGSLSCGYLPVLASNSYNGSAVLITNNITSLLSVTITAPEAGNIAIMSANTFRHSHVVSSTSNYIYTIIESTPNSSSSDGLLVFNVPPSAGTDTYYTPLTNIKTFPVAAGTYTYYLNSYTVPSNSTSVYLGGRIQATWYPN